MGGGHASLLKQLCKCDLAQLRRKLLRQEVAESHRSSRFSTVTLGSHTGFGRRVFQRPYFLGTAAQGGTVACPRSPGQAMVNLAWPALGWILARAAHSSDQSLHSLCLAPRRPLGRPDMSSGRSSQAPVPGKS